MDDQGFILVALLIGIAVAGVWMAALLPSYRQQVIRERETELIFRGEQYARAIWLYRQQMNGALPSSFDDLISQHVLRHEWKDPITGKDFLPKAQCLQIPTGAPQGNGPGGGSAGRGSASGLRQGGDLSTQLFQAPAGQSGFQAPTPQGPGQAPGQSPGGGRGGTFPGVGPGQVPGGLAPGHTGQGICGVQSQSTDTSIKIYNGQQEYDLWQFDINTAQALFARDVQRLGGAAGGAPSVGLPVGPGQRGRPPTNLGPGIGQAPRGGPGRNGAPRGPGARGRPGAAGPGGFGGGFGPRGGRSR